MPTFGVPPKGTQVSMETLLSYRQKQILLRLGCGLTEEVIAEKLEVSLSTVEKDREQAYRIMKQNSLVMALTAAMAKGEIKPEDLIFMYRMHYGI